MLLKKRFFFAKRIEQYINLNIELLENINILRLKGPFGNVGFSFSNTEIKFLNLNSDFLLKETKKDLFFKNLREGLRGILVPWLQKFAITGYQYKIAFSYIKNCLALHLGFTYWILIDLTNNNKLYLRIIKGKHIRSISRKFMLASADFQQFENLKKYLNTVRNLLPYKLKGLTFPKKPIKLKIGKKVKYR